MNKMFLSALSFLLSLVLSRFVPSDFLLSYPLAFMNIMEKGASQLTRPPSLFFFLFYFFYAQTLALFLVLCLFKTIFGSCKNFIFRPQVEVTWVAS
jgi:hypothetical protein